VQKRLIYLGDKTGITHIKIFGQVLERVKKQLERVDTVVVIYDAVIKFIDEKVHVGLDPNSEVFDL